MTTTDPTDRTSAPAATLVGSMRAVSSTRDFRCLFAATSVSRLGDQFVLIATPWLLMQLTDSPLLLGLVLALEGLPRAAFMLIGGAVTDRVAPRPVMVGCDLARGALTAVMAVVVLAGVVELWMVLAFALVFGLLSGLATPAENSILPSLVSGDDLQTGNAAIMGVSQLAAFVGPMLAGVVIAGFSETAIGVGVAFAVDAATFSVSALLCWLIGGGAVTSEDLSAAGLWPSIREGIGNAREDPPLRFVFSVLVTVNFFVVGPLLVGIPVLAHDRLPLGSTAFGVLMGAFAVGNLAGYVLAGGAPRPSSNTMRWIVLGVLAGFGVAVASLGVASNLYLDTPLLAGLGVGNGYLAVSLFTWIQSRTPGHLLGRTVSLVSFASLGLVSVSQAAAGALASWNLDALFVISGAMVIAIIARTSTSPGLQTFIDSLVRPEGARAGENSA